MDQVTVSSILVFSIAVLASVFLSYALVRYGSSWAISRSWDVPWSWQTMVGVYVAPDLWLVYVAPDLCSLISQHFWQPESVFLLALRILIFDFLFPFLMIYFLRSFYEPLPPDLFYWGLSNPFGLEEGWLLWAIIGLIVVHVVSTALMRIRDYLGDYLLFKMVWRRGGMRKKKKKKRHVEDKVVGSKLRALVQIWFSVEAFTLTPVVEEYSYRGFLMASLSSWVATPMAMVISSVIFALAHRDCPQLPHLFVAGLTLGLIYAQTRNLGTPIAMHVMWNFGVTWRGLIRSLTEIEFCRSWTTFATKYFSKRWPQPKTRDLINTGHELDQLTGSPKLRKRKNKLVGKH